MDVLIRKLTYEDAEEFTRLRLNALTINPEAFLITFDEENKDINSVSGRLKDKEKSGGKDFILGAYDKDSLIGMVGFYCDSFIKAEHKAYIWGMFVEPEYRGKNIGRKLLNKTIELSLHIERLEQILLNVVITNKEAKNLYYSAGFELFGTEKNAMKAGEEYFDEDYMILYLDKIRDIRL